MMADRLPAVLTPTDGSSSISMERALHQIADLIEDIEPESDSHTDRILASLDDLAVMLKAIER